MTDPADRRATLAEAVRELRRAEECIASARAMLMEVRLALEGDDEGEDAASDREFTPHGRGLVIGHAWAELAATSAEKVKQVAGGDISDDLQEGLMTAELRERLAAKR